MSSEASRGPAILALSDETGPADAIGDGSGTSILVLTDSPYRRVRMVLDPGAGALVPMRLDVLLRLPAQPWYPESSAWHFYLPVGMAAAVAGLIVWLDLQRRVVRPLTALAGLTASGTAGAPEPSGRGGDAFAAVAEALQAARRAEQHWRRRTQEMSHNADRRIAAETRQARILLRRVRREAEADPLTGVSNRRLLEQRLPALFQAQRSAGGDLSVVMMDIDHFKSLNDSLGHRAGDELLAFAGELIRQNLPSGALAVRYGGDEFVLILPHVSIEGARTRVERIVTLFAQRTRLLAVSPRPGMSWGAASLWNNAPADAGRLLEFADRALYRAKEARRGPRGERRTAAGPGRR